MSSLVIQTVRATPEQGLLLKRKAHEAALSKNTLVLIDCGLVAGVCQHCFCSDRFGCADGCQWADASRTVCSRCADFFEGRSQRSLFGMLFKNCEVDLP